MTRSNQSSYSPKIAKKVCFHPPYTFQSSSQSHQAFKAEAKAHGLEFHKVIQARVDLLRENQKPIPGVVPPKRRNMGRQDGVQWTGDSFLCAARVDGTREDDSNIPVDVARQWCEEERRQQFSLQQTTPSTTVTVVSLLDIARPAKRKGVHKEFEVLESAVSRVITLDDFSVTDGDDASDVWSLVSESSDSDSDEESLVDIRPSRSYASVLKR